jgi:pimeloyl-ACP methyl ester carboxylesterase
VGLTFRDSSAQAAPLLSTVRVNGVTLHYQSRGKGEAIVFVHGSLADYREWGPVVFLIRAERETLARPATALAMCLRSS